MRSYQHAIEVLVPAMIALRDEGKIRFLGLSESSGDDIEHETLQRALLDDCWDVMMVSFNLFNQSAREQVFARSIERDVAIEIMASARSQFSQPELLSAEVARLVATGRIAAGEINPDDPLDFLSVGGERLPVTEVSYRFASNEAGVHVVLVGTGRIAHLEENVEALGRGPLPMEVHDRLVRLFGHLREEVHVPGRVSGPS
jgi:predicted aldo/keto reductase-like oxidoreductase